MVRCSRIALIKSFNPEKAKAVISERKRYATRDALEMEAPVEVESRKSTTGSPPTAVVPLTQPEIRPTPKVRLFPEDASFNWYPFKSKRLAIKSCPTNEKRTGLTSLFSKMVGK